MDRRVIGERSDAVLRTAKPDDDAVGRAMILKNRRFHSMAVSQLKNRPYIAALRPCRDGGADRLLSRLPFFLPHV
jgi:hypothetical protein